MEFVADESIDRQEDFSELVYRQGRLTAGMVLVRLAGLSPGDKAETVVNAIRMHGHAFSQTFTVVTARTVRVRRTR